jgi:hypothetical protein
VTVASSTTPATITALQQLLSEADWPLRPPSVTLGLPRQPEREMVIIGNVTGSQEWASLGTQRRDEDYTIDLYVFVLWPGYTALEAMTRAYELWAVVEDTVRSNLAAGGTGVLWNEIARPAGDVTAEDEGFAYQISSGIRVRARI